MQRPPPDNVSLALSDKAGFSHTKAWILLFLRVRFLRVSLSLSNTHTYTHTQWICQQHSPLLFSSKWHSRLLSLAHFCFHLGAF